MKAQRCIGITERLRKYPLALERGNFSAESFQTILPTEFMGQDWYDYNRNGVYDPGADTYQTHSGGTAHVYGIEIEGALSLDLLSRRLTGWTLSGGFMWNYGKDRTNKQPLRHTHPARGLAKLRWENANPLRGLWFEFTGDFVRHFDRVPDDRLGHDPGCRNDPQAPASGDLRDDGLPGYSVFDVRGGFNLSETIQATFAVENLFNKKYRRAHSRWDEVGINFVSAIQIEY